MRRICDAHLRSIPLDAVHPASFCSWLGGATRSTSPIVVDHRAGLGIVHGREAAGLAVEHRLDDVWRARIDAAYAFPGVV